MSARRKILILGGTAEAAALARIIDPARFEVLTSVAGLTRAVSVPSPARRTGGFGGAEGLARFLAQHRTRAVVDATHPFASTISGNAHRACEQMSLPRLVVQRPPWSAKPADRWRSVTTLESVPGALLPSEQRVFLALGRQHLQPFQVMPGHWFLVRTVDPIEERLPLAHYEAVSQRGPFCVAPECELLERFRIQCVVSRNSGAQASAAKLEAARALQIPVIMVQRPAAPPGPRVETVEDAHDWLNRNL